MQKKGSKTSQHVARDVVRTKKMKDETDQDSSTASHAVVVEKQPKFHFYHAATNQFIVQNVLNQINKSLKTKTRFYSLEACFLLSIFVIMHMNYISVLGKK